MVPFLVKTFDELILETISVSRADKTPPEALGWKLSEEVGEFSESGLKENGYLKHKDPATIGPMEEELADIFLVALATVVATPKFNCMSDDELMLVIKDAWGRKLDKYDRIVKEIGGFCADLPDG